MKPKRTKKPAGRQRGAKARLDPAHWPDGEKEIIAEILLWLDQEFDADGFRIIKLCEAEWNFSGLVETGDVTAEFACKYEYAREIPSAYEAARNFLLVMQGDMPGNAYHAKVDSWPPQMIWGGGFPIPWMLIPVEHRRGVTRETIPPIWEVHPETFGRPCLLETHYRLGINWRLGVDAVEAALLKWVRSIRPAHVPSRRARPKRKVIEDRLAQLSAWRARRAGVGHGAFLRMVKDARAKPGSYLREYADPSAFRNAANAAQREIERMQRDAMARLKR